VFPKNKEAWETWRNSMTKIGSATVEHSEHFEGGSGNEPHDFVIFSTPTANVAWEVMGLPHPTIATAEIKSSADTTNEQPPIPSILDSVTETVKSVGTGAKVAGGVLLGVAALSIVVIVAKR
jgi:hypothetical protein